MANAGRRGSRTCIVVGAGVAGLLAARELQAAGIEVTVLEKSRGVGGRMATRRIGEAVFDHGAQYISASNAETRELLAEWEQHQVITLWSHGFPDRKGELSPLATPRYRGTAGMTSVAKALATGLDVRLEQKAVRLEVDGERWSVILDQGSRLQADQLLLTAPLPQSLDLIRGSGLSSSGSTWESLSAIQYTPCFALMVQLEGPSAIGAPGGIHLDGEPVRWVADNFRKGISRVLGSVTIHAGPGFSRDHFDDAPDRVVNKLLAAVREHLGAPVGSVQLHRWRFSEPTDSHPHDAVVLRQVPLMVLAGDAFGGPSIPGAARSGLAAAKLILSTM